MTKNKCRNKKRPDDGGSTTTARPGTLCGKDRQVHRSVLNLSASGFVLLDCVLEFAGVNEYATSTASAELSTDGISSGVERFGQQRIKVVEQMVHGLWC